MMTIKKEIATSFRHTDIDLWKQAMIWINEKAIDVMHIAKPFFNPNEETTIFNKYLLKTMSYMMEEKDVTSLCPLIVYKYSEPMHRDLSVNIYRNVLSMIQAHGQVFEVLYHSNYDGNSYQNCKMTYNESVKFAFDFSREIKEEIKKIRTSH